VTGTRRRLVVFGVVATLLAGVPVAEARPGKRAANAGASAIAVKALGSRPDVVSDGDALIEVTLPAAIAEQAVQVVAESGDGPSRDVTAGFVKVDARTYVGLVDGLAVGPNTVTAVAPGASGRLTLVNHDRRGPIFSGPQMQPWTCAVPSTDPKCDVPTTYAFFYISTDSTKSGFLPYDPANPPTDVATTTTDEGKTVPFVVRQETGAMNRGIYQVAVLFDPAQPATPTAPQSAWNRKMATIGGAGCGTKHGAGLSINVMDRRTLSKGFLTASSGLLHNGQNCNLVVQAETLSMLREHVVDSYGPVRYNIGHGCSGGSITMQQVANAYPGLIDGITVRCSFPDSFSSLTETYDCSLMIDYWDAAAARGVVWLPHQKAAASGHESESVCRQWVNVYAFHRLYDPANKPGLLGQQNCGVPAAQAFEPTTNPKGVRCALQDYMVNVFGSRAADGYANRPADNVGVQYGLDALRSGAITAEQFVDLNAAIGSYDINYQRQAARAEADPAGLEAVYRSGAVNEANNLGAVPIIDQRGHTTEDIHQDLYSYATRARLDRAHGDHANHVILIGPGPGPATQNGDNSFPNRGPDLVDKWLAAIERDTRSLPLRAKVVDNKPADAADTCFNGLGAPMPDQGLCWSLFKPTENPRQAAGEGLAVDIMKCSLKPLDLRDYSVVFSDAQWARLQAAFPGGVCDYSKPGVSQQGAVPWQTYADGPGGRPLSPG
jgi:Tannase-like family of unknown function (DUF6351)